MNIFFLDPVCGIDGLEDIIHFAVVGVRVIQIVVPIALIIWGSLDLLKGIIAGDDKKIKEARKPFIQRFISAVLVFLIPWLLDAALKAFVQIDPKANWAKCYNAAAEATKDKNDSKHPSDPGSFYQEK